MTSFALAARFFIVFFSLTAVWALPADAADDRSKVEFDRAEGGKVYFKAPEGVSAPPALQTGLLELNYLTTLRATEPEGYPYFVFAGKSCQNCSEDRAIYFVRPTSSGGSVKPESFVHPGKIFDPKTRALLLESRAFYGRCVPGRGELFVVFQRERIDRRRHLQESVMLVTPAPEHLQEQLIERHLPRIKNTLKQVKSKSCHEVEGRNRLMTARKVNLRPDRADENDDEEEDDAPTKENQTERDMSPPEAVSDAKPEIKT